MEPNPPTWPDSVRIVRDTDPIESIRERAREVQDGSWVGGSDENGDGDDGMVFTSEHHFSNRRIALLFAPGTYRGVDVEVGYYAQVAGLGRTPDDVRFVGDGCRGPYVPALNRHLVRNGAGTCLDTFWRCGENFSVDGDVRWAVSQAAPLRRVRVSGDLLLHDGDAYASGGHLADSRIDGTLRAGGQQQFLVRNVHLGAGAEGGAWSMVYVGCTGNVPKEEGGASRDDAVETVVERQDVRIEKPYVAMRDDRIRFELRVPRPWRRRGGGGGRDDDDPNHRVAGVRFGGGDGDGDDAREEDVRDFSRVRVVRADEPMERLVEALDDGMDVILTPGVYRLRGTLRVRHPDQVVLGLGLATLVAPADGSPCMHIASGVPGVRIAGIMLESSTQHSSSLLEWGEGKTTTRDPGDAERPGALFDVFCRVGGAAAAATTTTTTNDRESTSVDAMMRIHSGNVVGDNLWLWRADHAALREGERPNYPHISELYWQTEEGEFHVTTGFEVFGDDVTVYGLAVEHANGDQTVWHGENGSVFFYQCEFPYDVTRASFGERGYRGYRIDPMVRTHRLYAPGIYSNFRNDHVRVTTAIEHPKRQPGIRVVKPFTVKLDNLGGIDSIVNGAGGATVTQGKPVRLD